MTNAVPQIGTVHIFIGLSYLELTLDCRLELMIPTALKNNYQAIKQRKNIDHVKDLIIIISYCV